MIKKLTLFILILIRFIFTGLAQEKSEINGRYSFGIFCGFNELKEEILLSKVHRGNVGFISESWEKEGKFAQKILLSQGFGKLKTDLETEPQSLFISLKGTYSAGYKLLSIGRISNYSGLLLDYSLVLYEFPVWDESRAYWSTSVSAGIWDRLFVKLNENTDWITELSFCSPGFLSRPDEYRLYAQEEWTFPAIIKITHSKFRMGFLSSIIMINATSELRFHSGAGRFFSLFYEMVYSETSRVDDPALQIFRNSFGLRFGF